ncbi:MAG: glutamine-hydrolyzing carbamoyl-phosphate synthase small subunit [Phoenicibacter congonensis]|uniref:Carbamoyl phosphate synthase small chain n=1 Tax=Phoenicibacter congonensis TaxID=1944646 RepID=A0AA43UB64_9ACTN|nr:glutamine-hydrolyzing carbamoyl-phosphate synthase small subunit [Phoenicibacter congonensis]
MLEDGTSFRGFACGASGTAFGEICFNTTLEGYLEVITDPSYAGQIVTMTYPQIGNYGVNLDDCQSATPALRGLVVRDMCQTPSNFRSMMTLPEFLTKNNIVAIEGVDTRALVRHIRDFGAQKAAVSTVVLDEEQLLAEVKDSPSIVGQNLVKTVSRASVDSFDELPESQAFAFMQPAEKKYKVVAYDCGAKLAILQNLVRCGCEPTVVPWNTPAADVLEMHPDGVFFSNGPGDPDAVSETYEQVREIIGKVPVFGICLGHQMLSIAAGAKIEKLKYGHRGGNEPVMNLLTRRVEVTSQNHGFGCVFSSLGVLEDEFSDVEIPEGLNGSAEDLRAWVKAGVAPVVKNEKYGRIRLTHVNLNDGTPEGIQFLDVPAFCVQYHPEANPGPTDSHYLFTAFTRLMDGDEDYLNIDIAKDRLSGWKFGSAAEGKVN